MRCVHPAAEAIRAAADQVASRRRELTEGAGIEPRDLASFRRLALSLPPPRTALGAYRPLRRGGKSRVVRKPATGSLTDKSRWPSPDLVAHAVLIEELGPVPLVTTEEAARFLALSPHSLECYRAKGTGLAFYKFRKAVRYAVADLDVWIAKSRHTQTTGNLKRAY